MSFICTNASDSFCKASSSASLTSCSCPNPCKAEMASIFTLVCVCSWSKESSTSLKLASAVLSFLGNYIDQVNTDLDKQKLKAFAKELYSEASE